MKKTMQDGTVHKYPLNRRSNFRCEGYDGAYSMIDAATYDDTVYVLLEHNFYGDETALLVAALPNDWLRWYIGEKNGRIIKRFFIPAEDIIEATWDSIDIVLRDVYDAEDEDIEFWTDEEIDDMEDV